MIDEADRRLAARYGAARPGLNLVAVETAALPVTVVATDVLAQQRKPIALMNEFVLRFCEAGITSLAEIAAMCGLEERLIEDTIAEEVVQGNIVYHPARRTLALTPAGTRMCQELAAVQPVHTTIRVTFDRLAWRVADYSAAELISKADAERFGMLLLPGSRTTRIGQDDITTPALNAVLRVGDDPSAVEVLAIRRLRPNTHRYLPVKLLVYADGAGAEAEVALVVDDERSDAHDLAIAAMGGAGALGITVGPAGKRPEIDVDLEAVRVVEDGTSLDPGRDGEPASERGAVREIGVFEHPQVLGDALDRASRRLLLIAPWVKNAVVDDDFVRRLERRLRAGVKVHLAHGIGKDDSGSSPDALTRLATLQERYPASFVLARLANSHAKILIYDDVWVTTSFNWLSFKGDPDRTYRMEEGILVNLPDRVGKAYERYVAEIERLRVR